MNRGLVGLLAVLVVPTTLAQNSLLTDAVELATFSDARSVGVDPAGLIYVADAGAHVIHILDQTGRSVFVLGGPGTQEGEFDAPTGVDPTNGLAIVVADAGNGRLQRFTSTYQLIESIPLYGPGPDPVGSGASLGSGAGRERGDPSTSGQPLAVAVSEANEIFAIDESRSAVAKWNNSRRFVGLIGAAEDFGRLDEPVDVELQGDILVVADRKRRSLVVYDQFGGYITEFGGGLLEDLHGLASSDQLIIAAYGSHLAFFDRGGLLIVRSDTNLKTPVQDVAASGDRVLVLTAKKLYSFGMPAVLLPVRPTIDKPKANNK